MKIFILFAFVLFSISLQAQFQNSKALPFTWKTDTTIHSVPLSEIQILLPKGSFPTLDYPNFVGKTEGLKAFYSKEPVIVVSDGNNAKAYSLNILTMHEIANDELSGKPILVTYCPLCNSSIVYNRLVNSDTLEFEASGMLRNSDMVMLDRKTESLWQQIMGTGIVGHYNKTELEVIPSIVISVEDFFARYPAGKIMSTKTGSGKSYGTNPYVGYDSKSKPIGKFFDSEHLDKRLPAMERVIDIKNGDDYKVYTFTDASAAGVINDVFKTSSVVIFHQAGTVSVLDKKQIAASKDVGTATVFNAELGENKYHFSKKGNYFFDKETNSKWDITGRCLLGKSKGKQLFIEPHGSHFAFAWLAFYPNTKIYKR